MSVETGTGTDSMGDADPLSMIELMKWLNGRVEMNYPVGLDVKPSGSICLKLIHSEGGTYTYYGDRLTLYVSFLDDAIDLLCVCAVPGKEVYTHGSTYSPNMGPDEEVSGFRDRVGEALIALLLATSQTSTTEEYRT